MKVFVLLSAAAVLLALGSAATVHSGPRKHTLSFTGSKRQRPGAKKSRGQHSLSRAATARNKKNPAIVGGTNAREDVSRFLAFIEIRNKGQRTWSPHCTGTVISSDRVLSAAHCFSPKTLGSIQDMRVIINARDLGRGYDASDKAVHKVFAVHYARDYDFDFYASPDDIAVLTIDDYFDDAQPFAALAAAGVRRGTDVVAAGYGITNSDTNQSPTFVQEVVQRTRQYPFCYNRADPDEQWVLDPQRHMCASDPSFRRGGRSTCDGDSGGPLFTMHHGLMVVHGVTSFGPRHCEAPQAVSWFARVPFYKQHIEDHIWMEDDFDGIPELDPFWSETWYVGEH